MAPHEKCDGGRGQAAGGVLSEEAVGRNNVIDRMEGKTVDAKVKLFRVKYHLRSGPVPKELLWKMQDGKIVARALGSAGGQPRNASLPMHKCRQRAAVQSKRRGRMGSSGLALRGAPSTSAAPEHAGKDVPHKRYLRGGAADAPVELRGRLSARVLFRPHDPLRRDDRSFARGS